MYDLCGHRVHTKRIRADALGHKPQLLLVFESLVQREQNCPLGAGGGPGAAAGAQRTSFHTQRIHRKHILGTGFTIIPSWTMGTHHLAPIQQGQQAVIPGAGATPFLPPPPTAQRTEKMEKWIGGI